MFRETITKDELRDLPLIYFEGEITVVETMQEMDEAVRYLRKQTLLGFDTETKPAFKKGIINKVSLLQLSTSRRAFLFRLNKIDLSRDLCHILSDEKILKVGAAIHDDIKGLQKLYHFRAGGFIELQEYVKKFGINNFSLKKLSGIVLGSNISKSQQLSNWETPVLSNAQKRYAATDAWVSYKIFDSLRYFFDN